MVRWWTPKGSPKGSPKWTSRSLNPDLPASCPGGSVRVSLLQRLSIAPAVLKPGQHTWVSVCPIGPSTLAWSEVDKESTVTTKLESQQTPEGSCKQGVIGKARAAMPGLRSPPWWWGGGGRGARYGEMAQVQVPRVWWGSKPPPFTPGEDESRHLLSSPSGK